MKFSLLTYEPVPSIDELATRMELLAKLGFQGIELTARHPVDYPWDEVRTLVDRFQLPVVSLLSGWSYSNEGLCLCSPQADIRGRAVERLRGYVDDAARLGAVLVVGLMQGLRSDEPDGKVAGDRIANCLSQVAAYAERRGISVVIEPVNHLQVGFHHTAAEVAAVVGRVGSSALSYMLDTIHMNIEEKSILGTIRDHAPTIRHFHLCESNGGALGSGNLDFASVLRELKASGYDRFVSVKVYRHLPWDQAARQSAEFLRGLGHWPAA